MVSSSSLALLQAQVGGITCAVGQRRRVGQPLQDVDDLPGAALLQDRRGQAAVLAGQLLGARRGGRLVLHRGLDPEGGARSDRAGADPDPGQAADHRGGLAAGQPADLLHVTERADRGVLAIEPGHQQDLRLDVGLAGPGGQLGCLDGRPDLRAGDVNRHDHGGQHHGVVERQHRQREGFAHIGSLPWLPYLITQFKRRVARFVPAAVRAQRTAPGRHGGRGIREAGLAGSGSRRRLR